MQFEWDPRKAVINRRKHGISFEEAASVFNDPDALVSFDDAHSSIEERWTVIGLSNKLRVLVVTYTRRGNAVRVISARRAARSEAQEYGEA